MTPHKLPPLLLLLLTVLLAARPGGALARCPGCGQGVQTGCPRGCVEEEEGGSPAEGCAETESCARREGQPCGVYIPKCARGLQCQPPENEEAPLRALLLGHGRCRRAPSEENLKESKPHGDTSNPHDTSPKDTQRNSGTSTTPYRANVGAVQDTDMGPCRRHLDAVLQRLQAEVFRGAHALYVPNCDHKGFYRKRQCRSSQGQHRGPCWCVDRMGQPLPGSPDGNSLCPAGNSG
uniref:insulin-like growth factor-binding protein 6 n=1 Tax=Jaculus jaculus TaxID=51337 RepID=UPI001E1AF7BB|nr:insulin-like growth factor-binding protein 6 [Jaculus jaculus]